MEDEVSRLRRKLREDPRSTAFVALADALRRADRPAEALGVLRNGFRHHPEHAPGRVVLAKVHVDLGHFDLALGVLDEVVHADPGNTTALALMARLQLDAGRQRDARVLVERLEMLGSPQAPELRARLADTRTLDLARHDAFDSPVLAERWARRGDYARARRTWERLRAENPGHDGVAGRIDELEALARGVVADESEEPPGERAPLPGVEVVEQVLEDEPVERPRGAERYGALARALWRST